LAKQGKLELTWVGKDEQPRLEPRILVEDSVKSYGDSNAENMLIFGDNLLALKALEQEFMGKIKCIYIDPPYNTGNAFEYYDDGLEHSLWLNLMKPRLELLWSLLRSDGLLAVQIDDNEFARLYLLMVEICREQNLKVVSVKMAEPTGVKMAQVMKSGGIPKIKEYIILAGKSGIRGLHVERVPKEAWDGEYKTIIQNADRSEIDKLKEIIDNEERSEIDVRVADDICSRFAIDNVEAVCRRETNAALSNNWLYENAWRIVRTCATTEGAKRIADRKRATLDPSVSAFTIETPQRKMYVIKADYNSDSAQPRIRLLFADDYLTVHPGDFWQDIKTTGLGDEGGVDFTNGKKPEALIKRIVSMATNPGDWVLDSFAGSGTTGAVAHKMGRRWIMVELGEHCHTHIIPRLKKVIDGTDQGGISKAVNWQGGGGFKYYRLAESLLVRDKELSTKDAPVYLINPRYNEKMLIQAICKIENFHSRNDGRLHGVSSENRFLHVTTNLITQAYLDSLTEDIGLDQSLLIYCTRRRSNLEAPESIEIKLIPRDLLAKCDFREDA